MASPPHLTKWLMAGVPTIGALVLGWVLFQTRAEVRTLAHGMKSEKLRADSMETEWLIKANETARLRKDNEDLLNDLDRTDPELARRYREKQAALEVAQMNLDRATRERVRADDKAQEAQEQREVAEQSQVRTKEALDSLQISNRETIRLNEQKSASVVAQNSLALKGDPKLRGLMAVYAQRSLEQAGGDVNNEEVIRALQEALRLLELGQEPGVKGLKKPAQYLAPSQSGNSLYALGNDGRYLSIDPRNWTARTATDLTQGLDVLSGRAFLVEASNEIILTDRDGGIRVHDAKSGKLLASIKKTPHTEDIRAASSVGAKGIVACGDLNGLITVWQRNGTKLELLNSSSGKGKFRVLLDVPARSSIVGVDGTGGVTVVREDGRIATTNMPENETAWSMAPAGDKGVLIGTREGHVWSFDPSDNKITALYKGSGSAVECVAFDERSGSFAWINGAKVLTLRAPDAASQAKDLRMDIGVIPNTMVFGSSKVIYISTSEGIRPVICDSRMIAERICDLVGRTWTREEWDQQIGNGAPQSTCSGL